MCKLSRVNISRKKKKVTIQSGCLKHCLSQTMAFSETAVQKGISSGSEISSHYGIVQLKIDIIG